MLLVINMREAPSSPLVSLSWQLLFLAYLFLVFLSIISSVLSTVIGLSSWKQGFYFAIFLFKSLCFPAVVYGMKDEPTQPLPLQAFRELGPFHLPSPLPLSLSVALLPWHLIDATSVLWLPPVCLSESLKHLCQISQLTFLWSVSK